MSGSAEVFRKYPNPVFIETGSQLGDGIMNAINAGFEIIISIETSKESIEHCTERFKNYDNVVLIHDTSVNGIELMNLYVDSRATFWLDAHNEDDYPVLAELEAINRHYIKEHTILIDDLRMFDECKHGLSVEVIKKAALAINPAYKFRFEDGHVKNDILAIYL